MATSSTHKGWLNDRTNGRLAAVYNGTEVFDFDDEDMEIALSTTIAAATVTGNLTLSSTLTAGADGVGADGEQLTSGGAGAETDWSAAGSLRQFKNILRKRDDDQDVLKMLVETPVYDFQYKRKGETEERITSTGDVETVYTGIMADEAPFLMHYNGRILNPINTVGYLLLGIKALTAKVEALEAQLKPA